MYKIYADEKLLYDVNLEEYSVESPRFKVETNTCGEASFNIFPTHPLYSSLEKLKTLIEIKEGNDTVFRGRIVDDGKDINTIKNIDVEGVLAYTNDSVIPPFVFPDDFKPTGNVVRFFLNWLIDTHNSQVQDFQKFKLGNVTVTDKNNVIIRSSEDYKSTWETIKEKLFDSSLGGYLIVRYESDGNYIDYLSDFTTENVQDIEFGKNILDLKITSDASELYTAIVPLGGQIKTKDKDGNETETDERLTVESLPDGLVTDGVYKKGVYFYKKDLVDKYGWIVAPPSETTWDDVNELQYLRTNALAYFEGVIDFNGSIEFNAFDLHYSDSKISSFRVNKYVHCISKPHGIDIRTPLTMLEVDMADVQNTKISVGKQKRGLIDSETDRYNSLKDKVENIPSEVAGVTQEVVDYKLVNYYTKTETDKVVKDTKDEWSQTMSANTQEVKEYAKDYTDDQLKSYTKTTDMQTKIEQTASGIVTEATKNMTTKSDFNHLFCPELVTESDLTKWKKESTVSVESQDDGFYKVTSSSDSSYYGCYYDIPLEQDSTYLFEIDVKAGSYINATVGSSYSFGGMNGLCQSNQHIVRELKTTTTETCCRIYVYEVEGSTTYARNPSLTRILSDEQFEQAQIQYNAKIQQTAEELKTEVSKKVGDDEIISRINQSAEAVSIKANKIDLNGSVTANGYFKINEDGTVEINNGSILLNKDSQYFPCKTTITPQGLYTEQSGNDTSVNFRGDFYSGIIIGPGGNKTFEQLESWNQFKMDRLGFCISKGCLGFLGVADYGISLSKTSVPYRFHMLYGKSKYTTIEPGAITISGDLSVGGKKNRAVETEHFGTVLQNALETPTPTFADYGEAVIGEDGFIRIYIDDKFYETIDHSALYNVMLTKYGSGDLWVSIRDDDYFEVKGTPGLSFCWQILATQKGYNGDRLEEQTKVEFMDDWENTSEEEEKLENLDWYEDWSGELW